VYPMKWASRDWGIAMIILLIAAYIGWYFIESEISVSYGEDIGSLAQGVCVFSDPAYLADSRRFRGDVLAKLPPGYEFMDYAYEIKNTALSTFHRDVTSSKHIYRTRHPIYTCILYKYDGELLSVCPGSHATYPFVSARIVNFSGPSGTAFLFDSDLLHAGRENGCRERSVVQYKICHREDRGKLRHLEGTRAYKDEACRIGWDARVLRKLSYYFEFPVNYWLYPFMMRREPESTWTGAIQKMIPLQFYNN
jgi:hypothetical protein